MSRVGVSPFGAIQRAQDRAHRATLRRRLEAIASGKSDGAAVSLDEGRVDVAGVIEGVTRGLPAENVEVRRLVVALRNSGALDRLIDHLETRNVHQRAAAVRTVGALRLYDAVPSVAPLLLARDRPVSDASARALGKIGGSRSAQALVEAISRRGVSRRLVAELARGAPDQFIEASLTQPSKPGVRPALALAAGLRRRRTATSQLIALVQHGSRRERVISCRALAWIGAVTAIPIVIEALQERDWKLRMSAAKALGTLRAGDAAFQLRFLLTDRNPRVRKAAAQALRRIGR